MDEYTLVQTLNRGSYGTVELVKHKKTGELFAAKRISLDLSNHAEVQNEIDVHLRVLKHPRVVNLQHHFHSPETNEYILLLDYCSCGDLHERIASRKRASPTEIRRIMLQLLDVVEFCHDNQIYHRDIKPENLFLTAHGTLKLGDWGLATFSRLCSDFGTGSDQYMAPECFDPTAQAYDAAKADIWAIGIVLLNYLFGRNPFKQATSRDPLFKDFASSRETLYDIFPTLTSDVFKVLRHALTLNPDHRSIPKMREAMQNVKNWSTDMEAEMLEQKQRSLFSPPTGAPIGVPGPRSNAQKMPFGTPTAPASIPRPSIPSVPIVHNPFRVPSAVAQSLKSPANQSWDRRKMYTPPTSRGSFWARRSSRPQLPMHLEEPEQEDIEEEDEDDEEDEDTSSGSSNYKPSEMFSMDEFDISVS